MPVLVYTSFGEVPEDVRAHFSYPNQPKFLLSFDWFSLLFATSLHQTLSPRIYVLVDDRREPMGALFCGVSRGGSVRRLLSLTNFYSLEYAPSVVRGAPDQDTIVRQLIAHIATERPRWHAIRFSFLNLDTSGSQALSDHLRRAGFGVSPFFQYENWFLPLGGETFQTYFAGRPSQLRNTITRKQKRLEKHHDFSIKVIRQAGQVGELETAVQDFVAVYNASWKQAEPFPSFIPTLAATCASLGVLRLGVCHVGGKPAAGQLWITGGGKAIIYKLAYDEQYADLGVGSVLSREMFRIAIDEDHVDEIDYGVGSEAYKKDWMTSVRRLDGVLALNRRTATGAVLAAVEAARSAMRRGRAPGPRPQTGVVGPGRDPAAVEPR